MGGRTIRWLLPLLVVAIAGVGVAMAATAAMSSKKGTVKAVHSAKFGTILVAANGMTLYRYTPDKKKVSSCTGACAAYWPPLVVKRNARPTAGPGVKASLLGTTKRANGVLQVTYAGWPLYFYAGDKKRGETNGQGVQKIWYVVGQSGTLVKHTMTTGATKTTTTTTTTSNGYTWG